MAKILARNCSMCSCPRCYHSRFLVSEFTSTMSLTGRDGIVEDSNEDYDCQGMCLNCGYKCEMMPTNNGFIPVTPMRKILFFKGDLSR